MLRLCLHRAGPDRKCFQLRERYFALHRHGPGPDPVTRWRSLCTPAFCMRFAIARDARPGKLDWKRLLRRDAGQVLQPHPAFHHPPRCFPTLIAQQLPGGKPPAAYGRVVCMAGK